MKSKYISFQCMILQGKLLLNDIFKEAGTAGCMQHIHRKMMYGLGLKMKQSVSDKRVNHTPKISIQSIFSGAGYP